MESSDTKYSTTESEQNPDPSSDTIIPDSNEGGEVARPVTPSKKTKRLRRPSPDYQRSKSTNRPWGHKMNTRDVSRLESIRLMDHFEVVRIEKEREDEEKRVKEKMEKEEGGEKECELEKVVGDWLDELVELTIATPSKVTEEMLALRMCIQRIRAREELSAEEEVLLKDALTRVQGQKKEEDLEMKLEDDEEVTE